METNRIKNNNAIGKGLVMFFVAIITVIIFSNIFIKKAIETTGKQQKQKPTLSSDQQAKTSDTKKTVQHIQQNRTELHLGDPSESPGTAVARELEKADNNAENKIIYEPSIPGVILIQ